MPITFNCPCGESLVGEEEHAGLQVECPTCQRLLTIPKPDEKPKSAAPPPPPKKKLKMQADDEDDYLDEDGREKKPKKKRKKRFRDENPTTRRMMERAHAELDEEEARRGSGGGLAIHPGIVQGSLSMLLGVLVLVLACFLPCGGYYTLILAGVLILGGLVRIIFGFTGGGTD